MTRLILNIFRANGALLAAGDRLTASIGLTSARWQVMGAIASAETPLTVAAVAKSMGLTRQNVRVIVKELEAGGMLRLATNPQHQRASLVMLTAKGKRIETAVRALQEPFVEALSKDLDPRRIADCSDLLQTITVLLKSPSKDR